MALKLLVYICAIVQFASLLLLEHTKKFSLVCMNKAIK